MNSKARRKLRRADKQWSGLINSDKVSENRTTAVDRLVSQCVLTFTEMERNELTSHMGAMTKWMEHQNLYGDGFPASSARNVLRR